MERFFTIQIPASCFFRNITANVIYSIDCKQIVGVTDVAEASPDLNKRGRKSLPDRINNY